MHYRRWIVTSVIGAIIQSAGCARNAPTTTRPELASATRPEFAVGGEAEFPATRPSAVAILDEAWWAADAAPIFWRDGLRARVVEAAVEAQDLKRAAEWAVRIDSESEREEAMVGVSAAWARSGHPKEAREALRRVQVNSDWYADTIVTESALIDARAGRCGAALATVGKVEEPFVRAKAMAHIAAAVTVGEEDAKSRRLWSEAIDRCAAEAEHADVSLIAQTLRWLALTWHGIGDDAAAGRMLQQAVIACDRIGGKLAAENRRHVLCRIGVALAVANDYSAALAIFARVRGTEKTWDDPANREEALRDVARIEIRAGRIDRAIEAATSVTKFKQYQDDGLLDVAAALGQQGKFKEALEVCQKIDSGSRTVQAMLTVAIAQARQGDLTAARKTAASCSFVGGRFPKLKTFDYKNPRTWMAPYDAEGAFTMTSAEIDQERAADLCGVAMRLSVLLGRSPRIEAEEVKYVSGEVLMAAAEAQSASGQADTALSWARRLDDPAARAMALVGVARGLASHSAKAEDDGD